MTLDGTAPGCATHDIACASLPIFVGTTNTQVPIDFLSGNPGSDNTLGLDFAFTGDFAKLISTPADAFSITPHFPNWDDFHFDAPSLLALLADPSNIVDGLDTVLSTIQDLLSGQIFGVSLPLVGDFLKNAQNNPLVGALSDFRTQWLQPLAQLIRENNLDLDSLVQLIEDQVIGVLDGVAGGLLEDPGHSIGGGHLSSDDILFRLLNADGSVGNIFTAQSAQFDFTLGHDWSFTAAPIDLNLGIPALGIRRGSRRRSTSTLGFHLGFGVSLTDGFYLVTKAPGPVESPELDLSVAVNFSSVSCPDGSVDESNVTGQLLFLALKLRDGVDLNNDGQVNVQCDGGHQAPVNPQTNEISGLFFNGSLDITDPNHDGKLTFSELGSASLTDIFRPQMSGGAMLHVSATVDFSTLGPGLGNILPSISTAILVDFGFSLDADHGFQISSPQVVFADITLDLGSFISDFAGPILRSIKQVLDPLSWLIGPDGFLNMRIPLLSDLGGQRSPAPTSSPSSIPRTAPRSRASSPSSTSSTTSSTSSTRSRTTGRSSSTSATWSSSRAITPRRPTRQVVDHRLEVQPRPAEPEQRRGRRAEHQRPPDLRTCRCRGTCRRRGWTAAPAAATSEFTTACRATAASTSRSSATRRSSSTC